MNPDEPCSTTTTPRALPPAPAPVVSPSHTQQLTGSVFTTDQAKSRIEAAGYSDVSGLRRDHGVWQGKAAKDGLSVNVTLGADGKVIAQ